MHWQRGDRFVGPRAMRQIQPAQTDDNLQGEFQRPTVSRLEYGERLRRFDRHEP